MNSILNFTSLSIAAALLLAAGESASGQTLSVTTLTNLAFDQNLGATVDLSLPFNDESGRPVMLADCFNGKPVILDMGYYKCPMLCSLVLNGLVDSLDDLRPSIGKDFNVICVSISPTETPALAAAKKENYVRQYHRTGSAAGWRFLTGQEPAIKKLASQVGFHYAYDPSVGQYAHASGLVILTPDGRVSRYFLGVTYSSGEMDSALKTAGAKQVGSAVHQLLLLCCAFVPFIGKHSAEILAAVRVLSMAVMIGLFGYVIRAFCRKPAASVPEVKQ